MKYVILVLLLVTGTAFAKPSTWIYNENTDSIIADNSNVVRPIASLTKVMTAIVALEYDSNMSRQIFVGNGSKIPPGMNTRGDLFSAMLVRSDNQAAEILASNYPGGRKAFIRAMNRKAEELGMTGTKFVDPSGLGSGNVSTAGSVATMLQIAALQPIIADTSVLEQVEIKNKRYKVLLDNTNKMLLASFNEIKMSKTGFTNASGWSVGMVLEKQGRRFVVVVLGAQSKEQRYTLAKKMIESHFADIEYEIEKEKQQTWYNRFQNWLND